jgi:hypothetical protein
MLIDNWQQKRGLETKPADDSAGCARGATTQQKGGRGPGERKRPSSARDTQDGLPPARTTKWRARQRGQHVLVIRVDMSNRDIPYGESVAKQADQGSVTQPGNTEIGHALQRDTEV